MKPSRSEEDSTLGSTSQSDESPTRDASPTRYPKCDSTTLETKLRSTLGKISRLRKRPLFALVSETIDDSVLREIYSWKAELRKAGENDNLDVLVHSPGGGLTSCYMVARLFSRYTNSWIALVPDLAASGATLICLGSCQIVMSGIAQLGPLDPQVSSKRREKFFAVERQSPLEMFEALQYLRDFALDIIDRGMQFLLERKVAPPRALETSASFSHALLKPILSKIEPYDLGAFSLDSQLAKEYCKNISNPSNDAKKTQQNVKFRAIVELYPAHEFAIDIDEARELGFNVSEPEMELDQLFDEMRPWLSDVKSYIGLVPMQTDGDKS